MILSSIGEDFDPLYVVVCNTLYLKEDRLHAVVTPECSQEIFNLI